MLFACFMGKWRRSFLSLTNWQASIHNGLVNRGALLDLWTSWKIHLFWIYFLHQSSWNLGEWRKVVRFISSSYKIYKKFIYNIVTKLQKAIKNSTATGIAQKSCRALFPLRSLRKNNISIMKKKCKEETQKVLKGIFIFKLRKNKKKRSIQILIML